MVLIVTAKVSNKRCSVRIWWQLEYFLIFLLQPKLRRLYEKWLRLETAFKVKSQ